MDRFRDCIHSQNRNTVIALKEKRTQINFTNPDEEFIILIKPENCSSLTEKRCDRLLIIKRSLAGIFIELKGRHAEDGLKQLESTISQVKEMNVLNYMKAFLVTNNCPKITPKSLRDMKIWKRKYCSLKITRSSISIDLSTII